MRQDQFDRLLKIEEKLTDIFMDEADPSAWPGLGKASAKLSAGDRKERYLFKRAAAETAQLLVRTQLLIGQAGGQGTTPSDLPAQTEEEDNDIEREVVSAERDADRMRSALFARVSKTVLDGPKAG